MMGLRRRGGGVRVLGGRMGMRGRLILGGLGWGWITKREISDIVFYL